MNGNGVSVGIWFCQRVVALPLKADIMLRHF